MKKSAIILSSILLLSCSQFDKQNDAGNEFNKSVLTIPDSTATPEQLELKSRIRKVFLPKYVVVRNDRLVLLVDSAVFVEQNIPLEYIKYIQESLDETSDGIAKWKREGLDVDLNEMYERFKQECNQQKTDNVQ